MKKKMALLTMAAVLALSVTACGSSDSGSSSDDSSSSSSSEVANKDKPLVWFNRQPSNSSTGELDMNGRNQETFVELVHYLIVSCHYLLSIN